MSLGFLRDFKSESELSAFQPTRFVIYVNWHLPDILQELVPVTGGESYGENDKIRNHNSSTPANS
jgi:hypothetical protein